MHLSLLHVFIIIAFVFPASACAQPASQSAVIAQELDRLVELAKSSQRDQWWPAVQELGRIAARQPALRDDIWRRARVNTLGMKFVLVKPSTFTMGPDAHRLPDIQWAHVVQLTQPYYVSVTETTNEQFQQIFPSYVVNEKYSPDPDSPAVNISWRDADDFCRRISEREGAHYRLPTEAEWECACRAGSKTRYCYGNAVRKLSKYAWYDYEVGRASPVALLRPNKWGIYDMHGNALEWTSDWFSRAYYSECQKKGTVVDPKGPAQGWSRVLRGGSWALRNHRALRSTARYPLPLLDRKPFSGNSVGIRATIGFRIVREADTGEAVPKHATESRPVSTGATN